MLNKAAANVREKRAPARFADHDLRVRRTRQALVHAFIAAVEEKGYDAVTIQDLLDRAGVGRSTFYAHYRSKDDLHIKSLEGMLVALDACLDKGAAEGAADRVAPVRELFAHVAQVKDFHREIVRARVMERHHHAHVAITSRLMKRRLQAAGNGSKPAIPTEVQARAMAGALFALLTWWIESDYPESPERMDEMFHAAWRRP